MSFVLYNAPSIFMQLMAKILKHLLRKCVVICYDDILVYSKSREDHLQHMEEVFHILKPQLMLRLKKCSFLNTGIIFLGYAISSVGIQCKGQ